MKWKVLCTCCALLACVGIATADQPQSSANNVARTPEASDSIKSDTASNSPAATPTFKAKEQVSSIVSGSRALGIIWDNYPDDDLNGTVGSSQLAAGSFQSQTADDFIFTQTVDVEAVRWVGGLWNANPPIVNGGTFKILIYEDAGGSPPGPGLGDPSGFAIATYNILLNNIDITTIGTDRYEYYTELQTPFTAQANTRYWMAIQNVRTFPPQWGMGEAAIVPPVELGGRNGFPVLDVPYWQQEILGYAIKLYGEVGAVCGNNIVEFGEECDGTDDSACPGLCQPDCTCLALGACCYFGSCEGGGPITEQACADLGQGAPFDWFEGEDCFGENPTITCPGGPEEGACCFYEDGVPVDCIDSDVDGCGTVGGVFYGGEVCAEFTCPEDPCGPTSFFAQDKNGSIAYTIDQLPGTVGADNYFDINNDLSGLSWYGVLRRFSSGNWIACEKDVDEYRITIYGDDGAGIPDTTNVLCGPYTVEPFKLDTGDNFNDSPIWRYDATLDPACPATSGWIEIVGLYNGVDNCWSLWHGSVDGDARAFQYSIDTQPVEGDLLTDPDEDLAMCLTGVYIPSFGACCNDEDGTCQENVEALDCPAPLRHTPDTLCAELDPACGSAPGACCHLDGTCDIVANPGDCTGVDDVWLGRNTFCEDCPCRLVCPANGVAESESCGDNTNGGCNMDPGFETWEPLTLDTPVCGTIWGDGVAETRDTDWFEIQLQPGDYVWRVQSEIPVVGGLVSGDPPFNGNPNCTDVDVISPFGSGAPCGVVDVAISITEAGTYWFFVGTNGFLEFPCSEPYGSNYIAELRSPCDLTCDPGATPENEPDCFDGYVDTTNGGCNSDPNVFAPISLGDTICGTSGTYTTDGQGRRDTDWYQLVLTEDTEITIDFVAEFPASAGYIVYNEGFEGSGNCDQTAGVATLPANEPCTPQSGITDCLPAGTWWIFVSIDNDAAADVTCGSEYELTVTGEACGNPCPFDLDGNGAVGPGDVGVVKNSFGCDINLPECAALDFDNNGAVGPGDVGQVKNEFGPCP